MKKFISICPFTGDTTFDISRDGLACLTDDGEIWTVSLEKHGDKSHTWWTWEWRFIGKPDSFK